MNLSQSSCIICVVGFTNQMERRSIRPNGPGNKMMPSVPRRWIFLSPSTKLLNCCPTDCPQSPVGYKKGAEKPAKATMTWTRTWVHWEDEGFSQKQAYASWFWLAYSAQSRGCAVSGQNNVDVSVLIPPRIIHKAALSSCAQQLIQYVWAKREAAQGSSQTSAKEASHTCTLTHTPNQLLHLLIWHAVTSSKRQKHCCYTTL